MKILVLGLNPSERGGKAPTIKKLHSWLDVLEIKHVSFVNIYNKPGAFSLKDVQKDFLNDICPKYDRILALGTKVGNVLDLMHIPHFSLPHPSGLNRKLNDPKFVERVLKDCKNYIHGGNV